MAHLFRRLVLEISCIGEHCVAPLELAAGFFLISLSLGVVLAFFSVFQRNKKNEK